jgi:molybdopterin molybdotransferase
MEGFFNTLKVAEVLFDDAPPSATSTRWKTAAPRTHATPPVRASAPPSGGPRDGDPLPVEEAQRLICERIAPVDASETLPLLNALDRVLAADIISPINVPPTTTRRWTATPCAAPTCLPTARTFNVIGVAYAGHPFTQALQPGECVRIMTGAAIPPGCDTVLPQELAAAIDGDLSPSPTTLSAPAPTCAAPAKTCQRAASPSPPANCCARRSGPDRFARHR